MPKKREYAIQFHVERIADKVSAIADTHELHLPPKNDEELERSEAREAESDKLCFAPGSLLWFNIVGAKKFTGRIDDDGPLIVVEFDRNMKKATVRRGADKPVIVDADAHPVAMAILGLVK